MKAPATSRQPHRLVLALLALAAPACVRVVERVEETIIIPGAVSAEFDGEPVAQWFWRLNLSDRAERRAAAARLVEGGTSALPMLAALLHLRAERVSAQAKAALARIGEDAVPALVVLASDPDPDVRYHAVTVLRDLAPDSAPAIPALIAGLEDGYVPVALESARALAALRETAVPAVEALASALSHSHRLVRVASAGALASIGPAAAPACPALVTALADEDDAVRRCAADALASIGPAAAAAVDRLIGALGDESVHVGVSAAGALGSIGPAAGAAVPALEKARERPGLSSEAAWALSRITGAEVSPGAPAFGASDSEVTAVWAAKPGEWAMFGGSPSRNAVSAAKGVPRRWNIVTGENILWSAALGVETYGTPIVAGGTVFIGTDNARPRDLNVIGDMGVLMAFRAADGLFLWQDVAPPLGRGLDTFLLSTTTSSPLVEDGRLYYVTAQGQLRCLDTWGFLDLENDGPVGDEAITHFRGADIIWELDIAAELGVFPHEAPNCSVAPAGDLLMVCTSNGVDEAHTNIPAPRAPSFIGVDKRTGRVAWRVVGPSPRVLHGQWSSPSLAEVNGRTLAFFGGGDGWLYALDAAGGREVWRFDGNPKGAVWRPSGDIRGLVFRNNIIACPVADDGRVYLAMGQDPNHGQGKGRLYAIDPQGAGDVTASRRLWENADVGRSICTPVIEDGLLYLADYSGIVHCLEASTGEGVWTHDLLAPVWSALLVADGTVYVGDEDGMVTVLRAGREKDVLRAMDMGAPIWGGMAAADGVLYVATSRTLFAIGDSADPTAASLESP